MINQITFTRFVGAFLIVFFLFGEDIFQSDNDFLNSIRRKLNLGVSYFYVLSGFVMMIAYGSKNHINPREYYLNRFARIYPLHLLALLVSIVVSLLIVINYIQYFKWDFTAIILQLLLVHAWFPDYALSLNAPSWSVSAEVLFYLLFPLIFNKIIKKISYKNFSFLVISIWLISQISFNLYYFTDSYQYPSFGSYLLSYNPLFHLNSFLVGILGGYFYNNNSKKLIRNYDVWIILAIIATTLATYYSAQFFLHNGFLAFPFVFIIILISLNSGNITKIFNLRLSIYLGEISFAVYLLQSPVFILAERIFKIINLTNPYQRFAIGSILLLITSHFAFKYI